jgi:hypothetical protein
MYDICPNTNPNLIGLTALLNAVAPYYPWPNCVDSLNENNCVADLGFTAPLSTGSVYNPTDLPASGTQPLTNIAGEVTSPASGSVFSYTAIGQEWTVTALSIGAVKATTAPQNSAANTGGSGATGTVGGGTSVTGTSAGSPGTTKQSGAMKIALRISSFLTPIILWAAAVCL